MRKLLVLLALVGFGMTGCGEKETPAPPPADNTTTPEQPANP